MSEYVRQCVCVGTDPLCWVCHGSGVVPDSLWDIMPIEVTSERLWDLPAPFIEVWVAVVNSSECRDTCCLHGQATTLCQPHIAVFEKLVAKSAEALGYELALDP